MVVEKHNLKRTDRQQLKSPDIRRKMKKLDDMYALERQASLSPSDLMRLEGEGKRKKAGKAYHSAEFEMVPSVHSGGRKHKIMKGGARGDPDYRDPDYRDPNYRVGDFNRAEDRRQVESRAERAMARRMAAAPSVVPPAPPASAPAGRVPSRARITPLPSGSGKRGRPKKMKEESESDDEMEGCGKLEITHHSGGKARLYGKELGEMVKNDKDFERLVGKGFWKDFVKGFNMVMKPAGAVMSMLPDPRAKALGVGMSGLATGLEKLAGKGRKGKMSCGGKVGSPLQIENPNVVGGKRKLSKGASDWIQFVKKVAKDKGITYPQALKVASKLRK
jgi:hypothetical protein